MLSLSRFEEIMKIHTLFGKEWCRVLVSMGYTEGTVPRMMNFYRAGKNAKQGELPALLNG